MIMRLLPGRIMGVMIALASFASGQAINWYCTANKTNHASDGSNMTGAFAFEVGVFSNGFIPTTSNLNQWSTYWTSAGSASYNPTTKSYDDQIAVTSNAAPFNVGAKGYVWGRATTATGGQWILFRHTSWTWPSAAVFDFPLAWDAAAANEVLVGSINPTGTPFLKSDSVMSYAQWRTLYLTGNPLNGTADDPDGDGVSNGVEFACGTSPVVAGVPPWTSSIITSGGQSYLQLTVSRLRTRLATMGVEASSNLTSWTTAATETANTATSWSVRDSVAITAGTPKRFMRFKAVIQP